MDATWIICIILLVIAGICGYVIYKKQSETFKHVGKPASLHDGIYSIVSADGSPLVSTIVDTVQCKDFLIGQVQPSKQQDWQLKRVADSIYIFYKLGKQECMYSSPNNEVRSYFFPTCNSQNLCGLEEPDYKGELDSESLRTYFMVLQHPSGQYYIKNMKNDMYLCMSKKHGLKFVKQLSADCLFSIAPSVHQSSSIPSIEDAQVDF